MSVLSDLDILRAMDDGTIRIVPFDARSALGNCSYDVTLGRHFYRMAERTDPSRVYSVLEEADTLDFWCKEHETVGDDGRMVLRPGETVLAHTVEFIGGRRDIVPMMKARSSIGRWGLSVCKCAGWGDVGYVNRWTMEITNHSDVLVALTAGTRVAQIVFMRTVTPPSVAYDSKYQNGESIVSGFSELEERWSPREMLPRLYVEKKT